jgi:hypothetical protein
MGARTKFIVYKIAGYGFLGLALYFLVKAFFLFRGVADLPITALDFKIGMTHVVREAVAGIAVGFVGALFHYSAGLHKKDIDFF